MKRNYYNIESYKIKINLGLVLNFIEKLGPKGTH